MCVCVCVCVSQQRTLADRSALAVPRLTPRLLLLLVSLSVVTLAEVVLAASRMPYEFSAETLNTIRNLVPKIEKARLYRGRGGEMVRGAVCRLLECVALAAHPLTSRAQVNEGVCVCVCVCVCTRVP